MGTQTLGSIVNTIKSFVSSGTISTMVVSEPGTIKFDANKHYFYVNGQKFIYKVEKDLNSNNSRSS